MTTNIKNEFPMADDIAKKWPKFNLLYSLGFPKAARNNICRTYWDKQETTGRRGQIFSLDTLKHVATLICQE